MTEVLLEKYGRKGYLYWNTGDGRGLVPVRSVHEDGDLVCAGSLNVQIDRAVGLAREQRVPLAVTDLDLLEKVLSAKKKAD